MKRQSSDDKITADYEAEQRQLIDETVVIEKELAKSEETIISETL